MSPWCYYRDCASELENTYLHNIAYKCKNFKAITTVRWSYFRRSKILSKIRIKIWFEFNTNCKSLVGTASYWESFALGYAIRLWVNPQWALLAFEWVGGERKSVSFIPLTK